MTEIPTNIDYKAEYIAPGTTDPEEPSVTIPAGWWVVGMADTNDEAPDVLIHIDLAVDNDGNLIDEEIANRIAAGLATPPAEAEPRVFFNGDSVPAGVFVMDQNGEVHPDVDESEEDWDNGNLGPLVEILLDYDAEVERARREATDG